MIKVVYFIGQILFAPHLILFLLCGKKEIILLDLYSRAQQQRRGLRVLYDLSLELLLSRFFRTLFYFRINNVFTKLLRIVYPKERYFIIDAHTKLGSGVRLAHPYATILNAEVIGDGLYVNHLVTVGEKDGKKPIIGKNVQLHAGCMVLGGITIGNDAIIGAGAVVVKDIPDGAVVVGNPGRCL